MPLSEEKIVTQIQRRGPCEDEKASSPGTLKTTRKTKSYLERHEIGPSLEPSEKVWLCWLFDVGLWPSEQCEKVFLLP